MALVLLAALGSACGGAARYLLGSFVDARWQTAALGISIGTLAVNVIGSFAIAACLPWCRSEEMRALIVFGVLGGFTTFSSFSLHTLMFLEKGQWLPAALNVSASLICCLLAAAAGLWCARTWQ